MNHKTHIIEIYEPDGYDGPNPIRATGLGIVHGPDGSNNYLLEIDAPFKSGDERVSQIVVRPRHVNDGIERAVDSVCTVGIARVRPKKHIAPDGCYTFTDIVNMAIGKIRSPGP